MQGIAKNNREKTTKMIQDGQCLIDFDYDKNLYPRKLFQMWVQMITTTS